MYQMFMPYKEKTERLVSTDVQFREPRVTLMGRKVFFFLLNDRPKTNKNVLFHHWIHINNSKHIDAHSILLYCSISFNKAKHLTVLSWHLLPFGRVNVYLQHYSLVLLTYNFLGRYLRSREDVWQSLSTAMLLSGRSNPIEQLATAQSKLKEQTIVLYRR